MVGRTETEHARTRELETLRSPASVRGHPVHPMIVPLPIGLLAGAVAADVLFAASGTELFAEMAPWLLAGGLITGILAAAVGVVDFMILERPRRLRAGWVHSIGNGFVLVLTAINLVFRLMVGPAEAVLPWGLVLSLIAGALLAVGAWFGGELSFRYLIGVSPDRRFTADDGHTHLE